MKTKEIKPYPDHGNDPLGTVEVEVDGEKFRVGESAIRWRQRRSKNWIAACCGLADYGGMSWLEEPEDAIAIRIAGYRAGDFRSGYVVCSTIPAQESPKMVRAMEAAGFKRLDAAFPNPAHNSWNNVTVWGARTIFSECKHDGKPRRECGVCLPNGKNR